MLKLVHDGSESAVPGGSAAGSSLLDEIVRDGAPPDARGGVAG